MDEEEIEEGLSHAGWELDGSFYEHLIIGWAEELSILAYLPVLETEDLRFQLLDHDNDLGCWVREIVTPQRAAQLLQEYGEPMIEE